MSNLKDDKNKTLSVKDIRDLTVQTALQRLPYVGPIFSFYYKAKQEKRLRNIEFFCDDIAKRLNNLEDNEIKGIKVGLQSLSIIDKEAFLFIIDEIFDKIERENIAQKIEYFKQYFMNTLKNPACEANFDERRFFLDILASLSLLECELLGSIYSKNSSIEVLSLQREGVDKYAIVGSITRLRNYGFLESTEIRYRMENPLNDIVRITSFGRKFCDFCLSPSEE